MWLHVSVPSVEPLMEQVLNLLPPFRVLHRACLTSKVVETPLGPNFSSHLRYFVVQLVGADMTFFGGLPEV